MGRILILIVALFLISNAVSGQILHAFALNEKEDIQNKIAIEIIEELKIGDKTIKYYKKLNHRNQIIIDERFTGNDNFMARFTYKYDSITFLKSEYVQESNDENFYRKEKYEYDERGWLISITVFNKHGGITETTLVTNNEKGHPIKLEMFLANGILIGHEVAIYNYPQNKATYEKRDANSNPFHSGFFTIDPSLEKNNPKPGFEYDERGNLVKNLDGYNEIEYDQFENWISIKMHRKINGIDKITQEHKRIIKYF